ncbi:hypothetical protein ACH41H_25045 [Streptomyces sp. NPDC020800]|uniref:hypothetical protein n=1 Tax=Streptomyces sp. NPDC020800 TaxID=3365092 RepID=UPI0037B2230B
MTQLTSLLSMPTARDVFPSGTPGRICEDYNRRRKAQIIAMVLFRQLNGAVTEASIARITDERMDWAARSAEEKVPGSELTRSMIRAELRQLGGLPPVPFHQAGEQAAAATAPAGQLGSLLDPHQLSEILRLGLPVLVVPVPAA